MMAAAAAIAQRTGNGSESESCATEISDSGPGADQAAAS